MRNHLRILIADDDDGDRKQIRRSLKQASFAAEFAEASDGAEALLACERQDFDFAFIDYMMPGENGLDTVSALHDRCPHMPIVMVTGEGDEVIASEAIKRGAMDYIPKRVMTKESIERIVAGALERASLKRQVDQARNELETFASRLVHDLRAPLRAVVTFAELVDQGIKAGKVDTIEDDWRRVIRATDRMGTLIDALHLYTKTGAVISFAPVSMAMVMEDARLCLNAVIVERSAQVTVDPLPEVTGHDPLLVQLLQNLIGNGITYCEAAKPMVHVSAEREDDVWRFTVRDNGIGIPDEHREQIFLPFKRLHDDGEFAGTGLGLATCKRIVERHGGRIWCEAADQGGTDFRFTLPPAAHHPRSSSAIAS